MIGIYSKTLIACNILSGNEFNVKINLQYFNFSPEFDFEEFFPQNYQILLDCILFFDDNQYGNHFLISINVNVYLNLLIDEFNIFKQCTG